MASTVDTAMSSQEPQPQYVNVIVPSEWQVGVYANMAAVSSQGPHDVTLDFIQLVPAASATVPGAVTPVPTVVARLKLAPTFLMPLMQVLSNHLSQHEAMVRQAEGGDGPDSPPAAEGDT
jgi:hypothetical protein